VIPKRPINADVPEPENRDESEAKSEAPKQRAAKPREKKQAAADKKREPKSPAPKALAVLVVLALAFIAAAIVFGSSGEGDEGTTSPAPAPAPTNSADRTEDPASQPAEELGYPSFATNNTVRIGGSDPVANAAAVALAVFPSTTPEQRPAAVTMVGEDDWAGAIAASVLMAPPVQAPILFSNSEELPEVSEEALSALDPQGSETTGNAPLFTVGRLAYPGEAVPIDSGDAASTAAQIATLRDRLAGKPPRHIVIASSSQPEFAMPAAAWAARSGDPVLYSDAEKLPAATAAILKGHPKAPVYVLGPSSVISSDVVREIAKLAKRVKRVGGENPVANALAFARYRDGNFGWNVNDPGHGFVLARSDSPADAAAAAPLSASGTWGPLLLTDDAATLPADLRNYFLDVKPGYTTDPTRAFYNHVWVIGDQETIEVGQQAEVDELAELAKIGGGE
jgi:hypothetical protein